MRRLRRHHGAPGNRRAARKARCCGERVWRGRLGAQGVGRRLREVRRRAIHQGARRGRASGEQDDDSQRRARLPQGRAVRKSPYGQRNVRVLPDAREQGLRLQVKAVGGLHGLRVQPIPRPLRLPRGRGRLHHRRGGLRPRLALRRVPRRPRDGEPRGNPREHGRRRGVRGQQAHHGLNLQRAEHALTRVELGWQARRFPEVRVLQMDRPARRTRPRDVHHRARRRAAPHERPRMGHGRRHGRLRARFHRGCSARHAKTAGRARTATTSCSWTEWATPRRPRWPPSRRARRRYS